MDVGLLIVGLLVGLFAAFVLAMALTQVWPQFDAVACGLAVLLLLAIGAVAALLGVGIIIAAVSGGAP